MTKRKRPGTIAPATASTPPAKRRPIVMVSSTVYGITELLDRIHLLLTNRGYEVLMSHAGTVRVSSQHHAFADCLAAVDACDFFLGILTTHYGSGRDPESPQEPSITHQELRHAIALDKPRWFLAHSHVLFARSLLRAMGAKTAAQRAKITLSSERQVIDDVRVVDMYEEATQEDTRFVDRRGNWAQKFRDDRDAMTFILTQFPPRPETFDRHAEAEAIISRVMPVPPAASQRGDGSQP
jgi:hypothetical protein